MCYNFSVNIRLRLAAMFCSDGDEHKTTTGSSTSYIFINAINLWSSAPSLRQHPWSLMPTISRAISTHSRHSQLRSLALKSGLLQTGWDSTPGTEQCGSPAPPSPPLAEAAHLKTCNRKSSSKYCFGCLKHCQSLSSSLRETAQVPGTERCHQSERGSLSGQTCSRKASSIHYFRCSLVCLPLQLVLCSTALDGTLETGKPGAGHERDQACSTTTFSTCCRCC